MRSVRDRSRAVAVRLLAYLSGAAVLAALMADLFAGAPVGAAMKPVIHPGWLAASRPHPAFVISQLDLAGMTEPYEILRHPDGGRKDTLRWAPRPDGKPTAELQIYRPGGELAVSDPADAVAADIIGLSGPIRTEAAGVVASKFGPIGLIRWTGDQVHAQAGAQACMSFAKSFAAPRLEISGWVCQPPSSAAQRASIACALDRLVLLSAGNDPKMAELFAHAELKRIGCNAGAIAAADWVTAVQDPPLRGRL